MSDEIPSLLNEPILTLKDMQLLGDGSDPYETFAAYFYGLELETAKRFFDMERYTEIWVFVDILLNAWQVPPREMLQLIRDHNSYRVADTPAWHSAAALVCIEKTLSILRETTPPSPQAGRQAALWMQTATHFSGLALTVICGAEEAFADKVFRARQRRNRGGQQGPRRGTPKSVVVPIMAEYRKKGMTLKSFIDAATVGSINNLTITKESGVYIIDSDEIAGNKLPRRSYDALEHWWDETEKAKKVTLNSPVK